MEGNNIMRRLLGILILLLLAVSTLAACDVGDSDACKHTAMSEWKTVKATCTEDGSRSRFCLSAGCDYVENETISKLGHNIKSVAEISPTCTEVGYSAYETCLRCDYQTQCVQLPKADHDMGAPSILIEPTCISEGKQAAECKECGYTVLSNLPTTTHTEAIDEAKAPTCTATGLTEGKHCSVCNEVIVKQTVITALGHTEAIDEAKAPTCTESGLTEGKHCSVCSEVITAQKEVVALGHTYKTVLAVAATCDTAGVVGGSYCTRCDSGKEAAEKIIPALGHDMDEGVITVRPTCTEEGVKLFTCERGCGHTSTEAVDPIDHDLIDKVGKAATCTEAGYTAYKACTKCDYTEGKAVIGALGHDMDAGITTTAPTCTTSGVKTYTCKRGCGHTATETVAALDHDMDAGVITTQPTCTEAGVKTYTCKRGCGHTETAPVDAAGHDLIDKVGKAATCTEAGYTAYKACTRCDYIEGKTTIDALDHDMDEGLVTKDPTCTEAGVKTYTCKRGCGHTETETVLALGHDLKDQEGRAATCTEAGYTAYKACVRCEYIEGKDTIGALGHTNEKISAVKPGCETTGLTEGVRCSVCKEILVAQTTVPANGHTGNSVVTDKAPTCTEEGLQHGVCDVCGEDMEDKVIPALGHNEVIDDAVAPTCTEGGLTAGKHCSVCNAVTEEQKEVAARGHDMDAGVITTQPTCTDAGVKTYTCKRGCGHTTTASVDATGHNLIDKVGKAATCTDDGYTAYKACTKCDHIEGKAVIGAVGHDMDAGVITTQPTCTSEGVKTYTCKRECGYTTTESVSVIDHDMDDGVITVAPTCTGEGVKTYTCKSGCGYTTTETVDAVGHDLIDKVGKAATCTDDGYTAYKACTKCDHIEGKTVIGALGHDMDAGVITTQPTCTDAGVKTYTCKRGCGHSTTAVAEALGHDFADKTGKAATCTDAGYTAYKECARCNHIEGKTAIGALGHDMDAGVITAQPTCTGEGIKTYTCKRACGHTTTEVVGALGHSETSHDAKAPTCTEIGWDAYVDCSRCNYTTYDEIAALGHSYGELIEAIPATCEGAGAVEHYECSACHKYFNAEYAPLDSIEISATGHNYDSVVTDPTCTANGYTTHTCLVCGDTYTDATTTAIGHNYKSVVTDPTCTANGYTTHTCLVCGDTYTDATTTATGHDYKSVVTDPTCTANGYTTHTCLVCGDTYTDATTGATGHDYDSIVTDPTCTDKGYTTHTCDKCGDSYVDTVVDAHGHDMGEWVQTDYNREERECSICDHIEVKFADTNIDEEAWT